MIKTINYSNEELLKLKAAVDSSNEAIFITDLTGIITYINPGFTNLYGHQPADIIGKCTPRILKSGLMNPVDYQNYWNTLLNKEAVAGELLNKTKDGKIISVEASANCIQNEKGDIIGFIGIQRDITARKKVEEALKQSEEKFRKAFMTNPDAVCLNRISDGVFVTVNEGFTKIIGYTVEDIEGKSAIDLNIWADVANRDEVLRILQKAGRVENFEAIFRHKDGRIINGLLSASVIDFEGVPHMLNITKDISRRKQIEKALAQEQFLVNALLNTLPDHIYFKDLESRFIRNSKSHAISFGFENPDRLRGKTDFDFFEKEDAQKAFDDEQNIIRTGQILTKEEKFTRKDQTDAWFHAMKLPLRDVENNIVGTFGISRDVTVQKRAEEQLFLIANALKSVNDCVSITDMNDRVLFLNEGFLRTYGFSKDDLKEESISKIRSDKNPPELIAEILPATISGGWHGEIWNRRKDGSEFMVALSTSVVKADNGEPIALIGVANDITERKRMELLNQVIYEITKGVTTTSNLDELLKLVHKSLSKVVYAENIFVALYDQESDMFSFPYFVDKFDEVPPPLEMKKSCTSYVYRTEKPLLLSIELFNKLVEQNEVELVGSNSPSWVGIPLPTPSRTIGVLVLQHYEEEDIYKESDLNFLNSIGSQIAIAIERKQSEVALFESERDLNESQKIAGLGTYKLSFSTGMWTSSRILDSIFGIDEKYIRSIQGWVEIVHPEWSKVMSDYLQNEVIGRHQPFDKEYKIIRQNDQSERWVHGRGELVTDEKGDPLILIGNIVDITDRKVAEEEINLKNVLLQTINAEKDKFFSIIAHDLRGPLSAFVAATQILSEDIKNMTIEEISDISDSMKDSATNIYTLLENLLEWSRLQRGVMEFTPVKINLSNEIGICTNVLDGSAKKKNIEIITNIDEKLEVVADKHMLETILRNLISNAIKFTSFGGTVTIEGIETAAHKIRISVSDTGIGIPEDIKNKLFHLDGKTSRKGTEGEPSTGLGLLLCKEFIEKHKGSIQVESEVGKGSIFSFTVSA